MNEMTTEELEEADKFLRGNTKNLCPSCGRGGPHILLKETITVGVTRTFEDPVGGAECVVVVCEGCGFVSWYSSKIVMGMLEEE